MTNDAGEKEDEMVNIALKDPAGFPMEELEKAKKRDEVKKAMEAKAKASKKRSLIPRKLEKKEKTPATSSQVWATALYPGVRRGQFASFGQSLPPDESSRGLCVRSNLVCLP